MVTSFQFPLVKPSQVCLSTQGKVCYFELSSVLVVLFGVKTMNDDEGIDFRKLEKELALAVEADAKYERENSAKFRAVEQRVGSYEEFRDIVSAAHLKPLERKDIIGESNLNNFAFNIILE